MMTDHTNELKHAVRDICGHGGNVYAFAFGYLAGCIERAYGADSLTEARQHLAAAWALVALIERAPTPDPVPEGADPERCAYAKYYGTPEWHEHDHDDCREAVAEQSVQQATEENEREVSP
jgi:hypothetical protein